ncbi:MAG: tRNA (N(6)-L-threonylcarbamoyladenosine(37)-C(2))-methylthiotransferase MtaB [Thermoguttaceae bacterium]
MSTFRTATLGCKVNQYETEWVRTALMRLGLVPAQEGEPADLVFVNTCTITAQSDLKSRKLVRKLGKENPKSEIIVTGCSATRAPQEFAVLPRVAEVLTEKADVYRLLERRGLKPFEIPTGIITFSDRHRAYVKVQDGCSLRCAYCIVPKVRPHLQTRDSGPILDEIEALSQNGYREIVLTGIHLGHYGLDSVPQTNLTELVRSILDRIEQRNLPIRIRLSSLEAVEVSDELIGLLRDCPTHLCPHLHLSMQSGSDYVLRRMKRRWMSGPFLDRCLKIKEELDQPGLTTDVIVGFPGEEEEDFEQTCNLAQKIGFSKIHIFRFSARPGTEAANMPDRVSSSVQKERASRLSAIAEQLRADYAKSLVGRTVQVLVETDEKSETGKRCETGEIGDTGKTGKTGETDKMVEECKNDERCRINERGETDLRNGELESFLFSGTADRYLKVLHPGSSDQLGQLVDVCIARSQGEDLFGDLNRAGSDGFVDPETHERHEK